MKAVHILSPTSVWSTLFSLLTLFWKNKSRFVRSPCCLCVYESPLNNFCMPEPIFMILGTHVMETEPISKVYFINPSHRSVCLYEYVPPSYGCKTTARLILSLHSVLDNTFPRPGIHATIEEMLDASFFFAGRLIKGESVGLSVYPPIVAR
jgi:hypothetical protein